jgi:hypothetical protein
VIHPVPKPKAKRRAKARGLSRKTRIRPRNPKRKGSAFPEMRDAKFRRWVWTENLCLLAGHHLPGRVSHHDRKWVLSTFGHGMIYMHVCWGGVTPAHVGKHQATGAPDFGVLVPLCKAAHQSYDEHRDVWPRATGYTEKKMALAASGYALQYVESGGVPAPQDGPR